MQSPVASQILLDGYIENNRIRKKWLIAQMFQYGLNDELFVRHFIQDKPYSYEWLTAKRSVSSERVRNKNNFTETVRQFFTDDVLQKMQTHYLNNIDEHIRQKIKFNKQIKTSTIHLFVEQNPMSLNIPKSDVWFNAFKGSGAYHTMSELIKYHSCRFTINNKQLNIYESLSQLEQLTDRCCGNYELLWITMQNLIIANKERILA